MPSIFNFQNSHMDTLIVRHIDPTTFLGLSQGSLVQTILTIVIFFLGYLSSKRLEIWKENRRLADLRRFFLTQVASLCDPMDRHIVSLRKLSELVSHEQPQDINVEFVVDLYLDPIRSLSQTDLFNAFRRGTRKSRDENLSHLSEIMKTIEFITVQRNGIAQWSETYKEDLRRFQQRWNQSTSSILGQFEAYRVNARSRDLRPLDDPFLGHIDQILHDWSKLDRFHEYAVVEVHLLVPIWEICKKHNVDSRATVFMPMILEAFGALSNIRHLSSNYSSALEEQVTRTDDRRSKFNKALHSLIES